MGHPAEGSAERLAEAVHMEKALLGGILLEQETLLPVIPILDPDDFYLPEDRKIYRAILEQKNAGEPIDFVAIYDRIQEISFDYFTALYDAALPGHVDYFAKKIKDAANRREAQSALKESIEALSFPLSDIEQQYETLAADLVGILKPKGGFQRIDQVLLETMKQLDGRAARDAVKTGIVALDNYTGGVNRSTYWVIAGRTSMGKSAMALTICLNAARSGDTAAYVCVEGTNIDMCERLLSMQSGVAVNRMQVADLREFDIANLAKAHGEMADHPLYLLDGQSRWPKLKAEIELLKLKDMNLKIVFVDYLGLIHHAGHKERWQEIGFISNDFKRLCISLQIAGVMLCQINRQTEGRKDHVPNLGDLRDSGAVEQDADLVMLLYRPGYYDKSKDQSETIVGIAKQRNGPTGSLTLNFDPKTMKFSDAAGETLLI